MPDNPSISRPLWMDAEVDKRRLRGEDESDVSRSRWYQEAAQARLEREDAGEWTTPEIDPDAIDLRHEQEAVADGGRAQG